MNQASSATDVVSTSHAINEGPSASDKWSTGVTSSGPSSGPAICDRALDSNFGAEINSGEVAFSLTDFGLREISRTTKQMRCQLNRELLPDVFLDGACFADTISRASVRYENELTEDEREQILRSIEQANAIAKTFERDFASGALSDPNTFQNFADNLMSAMHQDGTYYQFELTDDDGKRLDAVYPPPENENNIELRPGHSQGCLWISTGGDVNSDTSFVPLSALQERLLNDFIFFPSIGM
jgi:hypothetical protein